VVFEDAQSGVEAAKTGGFYCIGIGESYVLSLADAVVPSMEGMTVERMESLVTSGE
jgi:beta-phosphoglucomutase